MSFIRCPCLRPKGLFRRGWLKREANQIGFDCREADARAAVLAERIGGRGQLRPVDVHRLVGRHAVRVPLVSRRPTVDVGAENSDLACLTANEPVDSRLRGPPPGRQLQLSRDQRGRPLQFVRSSQSEW